MAPPKRFNTPKWMADIAAADELPSSMCFLEAWAARYYEKISDEEYYRHVFAHLTGASHMSDNTDESIRTLQKHDPFAYSVLNCSKKMARVKDATPFEQVFMAYTAGDLEAIKSIVHNMQEEYVPYLLQMLAIQGLVERRSGVLEFCLKRGFEYDSDFISRADLVNKDRDPETFRVIEESEFLRPLYIGLPTFPSRHVQGTDIGNKAANEHEALLVLTSPHSDKLELRANRGHVNGETIATGKLHEFIMSKADMTIWGRTERWGKEYGSFTGLGYLSWEPSGDAGFVAEGNGKLLAQYKVSTDAPITQGIFRSLSFGHHLGLSSSSDRAGQEAEARLEIFTRGLSQEQLEELVVATALEGARSKKYKSADGLERIVGLTASLFKIQTEKKKDYALTENREVYPKLKAIKSPYHRAVS
ncbi:hypothetical protein NUW58_g2833 [Xylaria curta]|uniref:Uncharacterized protein n=2 Tax=Xylaria curta TaxID=42375 RepID=A0ACC1PFG3_9PEZI|nr:hypothetical protein NUW58_g7252 [Xylaria curta]KAJ2990668.1 hypothetical protein NUW58_g2833 [Xylaria curta]